MRAGKNPQQSLRQIEAAEVQLHVALDNMPGALVYTDDDLNIVICNDRFREMYAALAELLRPGRPYSAFLRYLATNGYYGEGDIEALVGWRACAIRRIALLKIGHPTARSTRFAAVA